MIYLSHKFKVALIIPKRWHSGLGRFRFSHSERNLTGIEREKILLFHSCFKMYCNTQIKQRSIECAKLCIIYILDNYKLGNKIAILYSICIDSIHWVLLALAINLFFTSGGFPSVDRAAICFFSIITCERDSLDGSEIMRIPRIRSGK